MVRLLSSPRMNLPALTLTLTTVPASSALAAGQRFGVSAEPCVIGRSPEADVLLADATVSRRHVRLRVMPGQGVEVVRLTSSNGVFIDDEAVGERGVASDGARLQLGGVVMVVRVRPDLLLALAEVATAPVTHPVRATPPLQWSVVWDAGSCSVALDGVLLDLAPLPTKVLATLLEGAPEVVHRWDLEDRVGPGANLAQAVSGVRAALRARLTETQREAARAAVAARLGDRLTDADGVDALLRRYLANKRGHGYLICASAEQVEVAHR